MKGDIPTSGWFNIESGKIIDYSFKIKDYVVTYNTDDNKTTAIKNGTLKEEPKGDYTVYNVGDSITIDEIGYHVIKKSNTTNEYVTLLRDESIGEMIFDENGGIDYETSTLKTYLNTTYKDTFGENKEYIKEITLLDLGELLKKEIQTEYGDSYYLSLNGSEGTYGFLYNNYKDETWFPSERMWTKSILNLSDFSKTDNGLGIFISSFEQTSDINGSPYNEIYGISLEIAVSPNILDLDPLNGYLLSGITGLGAPGINKYKFATRPVITVSKDIIK